MSNNKNDFKAYVEDMLTVLKNDSYSELDRIKTKDGKSFLYYNKKERFFNLTNILSNLEFFPFFNKEKTLQELANFDFSNINNKDFFVCEQNGVRFASCLYLVCVNEVLQGWQDVFHTSHNSSFSISKSLFTIGNRDGAKLLDWLDKYEYALINSPSEFKNELADLEEKKNAFIDRFVQITTPIFKFLKSVYSNKDAWTLKSLQNDSVPGNLLICNLEYICQFENDFLIEAERLKQAKLKLAISNTQNEIKLQDLYNKLNNLASNFKDGFYYICQDFIFYSKILFSTKRLQDHTGFLYDCYLNKLKQALNQACNDVNIERISSILNNLSNWGQSGDGFGSNDSGLLSLIKRNYKLKKQLTQNQQTETYINLSNIDIADNKQIFNDVQIILEPTNFLLCNNKFFKNVKIRVYYDYVKKMQDNLVFGRNKNFLQFTSNNTFFNYQFVQTNINNILLKKDLTSINKKQDESNEAPSSFIETDRAYLDFITFNNNINLQFDFNEESPLFLYDCLLEEKPFYNSDSVVFKQINKSNIEEVRKVVNNYLIALKYYIIQNFNQGVLKWIGIANEEVLLPIEKSIDNQERKRSNGITKEIRFKR